MAMTATPADIRGKSFARIFWLVLALFLSGVFFATSAVGQSRPALRWVAASLILVAGCLPLAIQLRIGFALDRSWVARYGRKTEPVRYWASIFLGAFVVAFWAYGAVVLVPA